MLSFSLIHISFLVFNSEFNSSILLKYFRSSVLRHFISSHYIRRRERDTQRVAERSFRLYTNGCECIGLWLSFSTDSSVFILLFHFHTLSFRSLVLANMFFLIVNIFIIIFFNSFCNLL
jgi:hypothetical protein